MGINLSKIGKKIREAKKLKEKEKKKRLFKPKEKLPEKNRVEGKPSPKPKLKKAEKEKTEIREEKIEEPIKGLEEKPVKLRGGPRRPEKSEKTGEPKEDPAEKKREKREGRKDVVTVEEGVKIEEKPKSLERKGYQELELFGTNHVQEKQIIPEEVLAKKRSAYEVFPLITLTLHGKEITFAYGTIKWSEKLQSLAYYVSEPPLTPKEKARLEDLKQTIEEKLNINFGEVRSEKAMKYLIDTFQEIVKEQGLKISEDQKLKFEYYIYRDFIGLGRIEPLMHDPNIEDISCDGVNIPIFLYHRNPLYGELQTNVVFEEKEELDAFVLRLAQKAGRSLSIASPLLDGSLPDGSRVQATYGTDIAMKGSNFTIRKFTKEPLTPIHLMDFETVNAEILSYLWLAVENKLSVLIAGATATGKTSFLNALSLFIKPALKIISIEDTPELTLPHPNWIPQVARTGFGVKGYGEVSMFDLLKSSLRQRPDYIIVGEVRGEEAYVMFQGMSTGHPSMGTLHADSIQAVIDRLTNKPINLPKAMLEALDIVVFLILSKKKGEYIRKVKAVNEIISYEFQTQQIITNTPFTWDSSTDEFESHKSTILDRIKEKMGYSIDALRSDLAFRIKVLKWMQAQGIKDYKEVADVVSMFYSNPRYLMNLMKQYPARRDAEISRATR